MIRYSYFAVNLAYGKVPAYITWLRYNTFFVLYPMGISSECWLIWRAMEPARSWNLAYEFLLKAVLLIYIPGESSFPSFFLWSWKVGGNGFADVCDRLVCAFHAYDGAEEKGYAWGKEQGGMSCPPGGLDLSKGRIFSVLRWSKLLDLRDDIRISSTFCRE